MNSRIKLFFGNLQQEDALIGESFLQGTVVNCVLNPGFQSKATACHQIPSIPQLHINNVHDPLRDGNIR